jgi:hypothetical protein
LAALAAAAAAAAAAVALLLGLMLQRDVIFRFYAMWCLD